MPMASMRPGCGRSPASSINRRPRSCCALRCLAPLCGYVPIPRLVSRSVASGTTRWAPGCGWRPRAGLPLRTRGLSPPARLTCWSRPVTARRLTGPRRTRRGLNRGCGTWAPRAVTCTAKIRWTRRCGRLRAVLQPDGRHRGRPRDRNRCRATGRQARRRGQDPRRVDGHHRARSRARTAQPDRRVGFRAARSRRRLRLDRGRRNSDRVARHGRDVGKQLATARQQGHCRAMNTSPVAASYGRRDS
jgi:hypothetical protein